MGLDFSFSKKFPKLNDAKIKEGIFVGPDMRKLIDDLSFLSSLSSIEKEAWSAFVHVIISLTTSSQQIFMKE